MMNKRIFSLRLMIFFLGIMGIFLYAMDAMAQVKVTVGNSAFTQAYDALHSTFVQARAVVYILSGFGLVGFAVAAIFGKLSFRWLSMIAIALFMLAMADEIVSYTVGAGSNGILGGVVSFDPSYAGDSEFNLNGVDNSFDLKYEDLIR